MSDPAVKVGSGKGGFGLAIVAVAASAIGLLLVLPDGKPARPLPLPSTSSPAPQAPEILTRAQFRDRCRPVMARDACLASLGPPDRTMTGNSGEFWFYSNRTRDELTGATDSAAQLKIEAGQVTALNFY